jgi:hypothetical protein
MNDEAGTVNTIWDGIVIMKAVGIESGTFDQATTAIDGDEARIMTYDEAIEATHEAGKTTGDDQVDGTLITDGMKLGTVKTFDDGMVAITETGTDSGTFSNETIATDGDDERMMTWVDGKLLTNETGRAIGDYQVAGMTTWVGIETNGLGVGVGKVGNDGIGAGRVTYGALQASTAVLETMT